MNWVYFALMSVVTLMPVESFAQGVNVGASVFGLASIQPRDDTYIGGPYLSEGQGGFGPGLGGGISVIAPNGFVAAGEFTSAIFTVEQSGRLVSGCAISSLECTTHTSSWHDHLLSGLIGYATSTGRTRGVFLGGVSKNLGSSS